MAVNELEMDEEDSSLELWMRFGTDQLYDNLNNTSTAALKYGE